MAKKRLAVWYEVFCQGKGAKSRLPMWQEFISAADAAEKADYARSLSVKKILETYEATEKADFYTVFILPALKDGRWIAKKDGSPISPQGLVKRLQDWEKEDSPDSRARLKAIPQWAKDSVKYLLALERGVNRARAERRRADQGEQGEQDKKSGEQTVSVIARNVYALQQQSALLRRIHDLLVDGLNKQHSAQKVLDAMLSAISAKQAECETTIASLLCKTEDAQDSDKLIITI